MLFNSYEFILGFLPLVVVVFFLTGRTSRTWALGWLVLASLFFYAWWRPFNLLIIGPSLLVNFVLARVLMRLNAEGRSRASKAVLIAGIAFNVAVLGYFKYANFFVDALNGAFGTDIIFARVILPLGISFITFQKIAFLIDVHSQRIDRITLQGTACSSCFFRSSSPDRLCTTARWCLNSGAFPAGSTKAMWPLV